MNFYTAPPIRESYEGVFKDYIKTIYMREIKSYLGRRYLYYCSECLKVLGISHRKGF